MGDFVLVDIRDTVGIATLNRPNVLNAWHSPMRAQLKRVLEAFEDDPAVRGIVLTGAGQRAFGAGQDLEESRTFDGERSGTWISEWESLYGTIRRLTKPIVAALNGVAAGSAFQVALLCDLRVGHAGVRMGQPEINSGIPSTTGPWIMREHLGLARTIELTLTGRLMDAEECVFTGVINRLVGEDDVLAEAIGLARELGAKPPIAMALDKQRFNEMTEQGFRDALEAGLRLQKEAFESGEPARMMSEFFAQRAARKEEQSS